jgi:glycosyltransferase involved in cell wall biosynthesis
VFTSFINRLPGAKKLYQLYMPLMPRALYGFDLRAYDLVISSEAGPAKGIVPNPNAYHICYCHSPMRYFWDLYHEYLHTANWLVRFFMKLMGPSLRLWDISSANLVDRFITNSHYVAKRIRRYYHREAEVVYGPVGIEKFLGLKRDPQDFYLFFGQLVGYKRLDLAVAACGRSGRKLVVLGGGGRKRDLKKNKKNALISFVGRVSDEELGGYFSRTRALLFPGIEDFGIIPVEANAAGCPVIAYRDGGVLDSVKENSTGIFFDEQSPEALINAMDRFEAMEDRFTCREAFTRQVEQFSKEAFLERIQKVLEEGKYC